MKKKTSFKLVSVFFAVSLMMLLMSGCKKCESVDIGCGDVETCCKLGSCYYEYDGKKYECDGTDCSDAAEDVVAACMKKKSFDEITGDSLIIALEKKQQLLGLMGE